MSERRNESSAAQGHDDEGITPIETAPLIGRDKAAAVDLDAAVLLYAARYALGRMSGAAQDMEHAISANLAVFKHDAGCREALIRDIEEARAKDALGMPVDASCWNRTLGRLEACRG